jgi:C4-dicarboxylate-binding protein DctP
MMAVNNKAIADNQAAALATIKANAEVYKLTETERKAFKDAVEVVYKDYLAQGKLTQAELATMRSIVAGK